MRRLLIIADLAATTRSFRRGLWRFRDSYAVDSAHGDAEALARLRNRDFDAVVVDVASSERTIGLLRRIRDSHPCCVRVVFAPVTDHRRLLSDTGFADRCFAKPSLPQDFVAAIERDFP